MNKEQQNRLDELRRAIRELPDDARVQLYTGKREPIELQPIPPTVPQLKALEAELTRVEGLIYDRAVAKAGPNAEVARLTERLHRADGMANEINILTQENRRLAERVAELEEMLERFKTHLAQEGFTRMVNEIEAALKSKEAGEENE